MAQILLLICSYISPSVSHRHSTSLRLNKHPSMIPWLRFPLLHSYGRFPVFVGSRTPHSQLRIPSDRSHILIYSGYSPVTVTSFAPATSSPTMSSHRMITPLFPLRPHSIITNGRGTEDRYRCKRIPETGSRNVLPPALRYIKMFDLNAAFS